MFARTCAAGPGENKVRTRGARAAARPSRAGWKAGVATRPAAAGGSGQPAAGGAEPEAGLGEEPRGPAGEGPGGGGTAALSGNTGGLPRQPRRPGPPGEAGSEPRGSGALRGGGRLCGVAGEEQRSAGLPGVIFSCDVSVVR